MKTAKALREAMLESIAVDVTKWEADIENAALRNLKTNVTLSGEKDRLLIFAQELKSKGYTTQFEHLGDVYVLRVFWD